MREYLVNRKIIPGPYGIACPCCTKLHKGHSLKATKAAINRAFRRKFNSALICTAD